MSRQCPATPAAAVIDAGRRASVSDKSLTKTIATARKADRNDPRHIGASMPGKIISIVCAPGQAVKEGEPLLTLEAMKMETVVRAPRAGTVAEVVCKVKTPVQAEDLLVVMG